MHCRAFVSAILLASTLPACTRGGGSRTSTVEIPQSPVKEQALNNCWLYSGSAWIEALVIRGKGTPAPERGALDLSESYLMYRAFEEQITSDPALKKLTEGGAFFKFAYLVGFYGMMKEGDFIPEEAGKSRSERQVAARDYLNASLATGKLATDRSKETIRAELDKAFGVQVESLQDKVIYPDTFEVEKDKDGNPVMLDKVLNDWRIANWRIEKDAQGNVLKTDIPSEKNKELLQRVMRALNAGYPLVFDFNLDLHAVGDDGVLSAHTLAERGPGERGSHSVLLVDYIASGVDPATGFAFETREGEASEAQKTLAAEHGNVKAFIVKNSWGDKTAVAPSYLYSGHEQGGYHRLEADYLFSFLKVLERRSGREVESPVIVDFLLPPEF